MADYLLGSAGDDVKLWDVREYSLVKQYNPHSGRVSSLCWANDNSVSFILHPSLVYVRHSVQLRIGIYFRPGTGDIAYLPPRRRPGMGDIAMQTTPPPVRPSVCLSVCPSHLVFALYFENALIYFLETLQVRVPCHRSVLYSF